MEDNKLLKYINERGIKDSCYKDFLFNTDKDEMEFDLCSLNGFDFVVSHFLDESEINGYGLIATNNLLKTQGSQWLAIGLIEGDDVICMNTLTGAISIWMLQTGNGEYLEVAETFKDFLADCIA